MEEVHDVKRPEPEKFEGHRQNDPLAGKYKDHHTLINSVL